MGNAVLPVHYSALSHNALSCDSVDETESSSSEAGVEKLAPPGYKNGVLTEYYRYWDSSRQHLVKLSHSVTVYTEVCMHDVKSLDDQKEEFTAVFVLKFWWLDKRHKSIDAIVTLKNSSHEELTGTISRIYENGAMDFKENGKDKRILAKDEYDSWRFQNDDWQNWWFPDFTFINLTGESSLDLFKEQWRVSWLDERGSFVAWSRKFCLAFSEQLELRCFPLDRQLCRIKITAEKTVEEFQFVMKTKNLRKISEVVETFEVDKAMQEKCTAYVRYADYFLPFENNRSNISVLCHLERRGGYFFNNILLMVFLVNVMALCTFAIPVKDVSGRLGLLSGCFLAVLAYRYIVNEILPRKSYLTAADMYISFACLFQIGICAQTVVFGILRNREDGHKNADELNKRDNILGSLMALAWLAINIFLWCLWRLDMRQSWSSVYEDNKEPYAPVRECTRCEERWLSLMCTHGDKDSACKDCGAPVKRHYLTPQDVAPLVEEQELLKGPKEPPSTPGRSLSAR